MIELDAADQLLSHWVIWARDDSGPEEPGDHYVWRLTPFGGYRETKTPFQVDDDTLCRVDSALAALKQAYPDAWAEIRLYYIRRHERPESALERALRLFCSRY